MADPWLIPLAKEAYDHRSDIISGWDRIVTLLLGRKKTIVFTGMGGVGKTVLFDHLSGTAFDKNYEPPQEMSQAIEIGKMPARRKRIKISVLPGQESRPRLQAINELFYGDKPINGVVHVVANGFIELRSPEARQELIEKYGLDTLLRFREHQLREEVEDFDATCDVIRQSAQKHRMPNWMIVVVNKCDLYSSDLEAARAHYATGTNSPFRIRLSQLQQQLGFDNFRWTIAPACSWLDDFTWNGNTTKVQLNVSQRNHLLFRLSATLEQYCA